MLTRREVLTRTLGLATAASALGRTNWSVVGNFALAQGTNLRLNSFENSIALKPLQNALRLYEQSHDGVTISDEIASYDAYTQKLATLVAGGNPPDIMGANLTIIPQYANQNALMDLESLVPSVIDISDYPKPVVDADRVNGHLYGIPFDNVSPAAFFNNALFSKAGVPMPPAQWTWDDFKQTAIALAEGLGSGYWGTEDISGNSWEAFEFWLRPNGKTWWTSEGKPGFDNQDLSSWLQFWDDLRNAGAAPPGPIQAQQNQSQSETSLFAAGKTAMVENLTPQFANIAGHLADNGASLSLHFMPNGFSQADLKQHHFVFAGYSQAIAAQSKNQPQAADVINFLLTDPDGTAAYLTVSGRIPASKKLRDAVRQNNQSDPVKLALLDYIDSIAQSPDFVALQGPPDLTDLLGRVAQSVSFGQSTVQDAADQFFSQASGIVQQ
jgi:multiple sugar transport system substrate-binding protein